MNTKDKKKRADPLAFKKSDKAEVTKNAAIIEAMFKSFGMNVRVAEICSFRYYIQYRIEIEFGISVEEILKKKKDLALVLASPTGKVIIIAPIPNLPFIGINLPKRKKGQKEYVSPSVDPDNATTLKDEISDLKEISNIEIEALIDMGIHLLRSNQYPIVSAPLFQRSLMIDEQKSVIVFGELQKLNIIINVRENPDDLGVLIGDVDVNALRQMMVN